MSMWDWFEHYWSSFGLGAALVFVALLLFANTFRSRTDVSRWRDPVWLSWLMVVAYLLHNFEEYGIDAKGRAFHFPVTACAQYGFNATESCPLVPSFFVAVNVPFVWCVLPIAALWCRRNPAVGLTGAGLLFTNALSHIIGAFTPMGYSPGTVSAAVIFIPLSVWIFVCFFGSGKLLGYPILIVILAASVLAQAVLLALLLGLSHVTIPLAVAIAIQTIDPLLLLLLPWVASRRWPPTPTPA
ncbi:HXXEE domain-containing protein [Mycobacteroides abscessus]|nr:HXXEE domain-containing protein [Mycobacteroides abscessus]